MKKNNKIIPNKKINKYLILLSIFLFGIIIFLLLTNTYNNKNNIINKCLTEENYTKEKETKKINWKNNQDINFIGVFDENVDPTKYSNIWGLENVEKLENGTYKIKYPIGSYKPSVDPRGGAGFIYKLDEAHEKAKLTYDIKFDKDFNFIKGGKLSGFCGGTCPRGGADANDGFSTRFMWRENGNSEIYAYLPGDGGTLGQSFGRGLFFFEKDKFYELSQEIIMNDIGKNNGIINIYIDGKKVYTNNKITFRNNKSITIDSIMFSTFFGGGDESWATPKKVYTYMKNFRIDY